ncbi:MAG: hypothetical protein Fur006_66820 [Coleofasciculaceae cyanobacterium]
MFSRNITDVGEQVSVLYNSKPNPHIELGESLTENTLTPYRLKDEGEKRGCSLRLTCLSLSKALAGLFDTMVAIE